MPLDLDLFGAPPGIRLAHVRGRLDGRDELKGSVRDANEPDDGTPDDLPRRVAVEDDDADEDVDFVFPLTVSRCARGPQKEGCYLKGAGQNLQIPPPMKEKRNEQ